MADPQRIQLSRRKGWKMPPNTVKVDRTTMWGNRWKIGVWSNALGRNVATIEEAIDLYRCLQWPDAHHRAWVREKLGGHNLACWCRLCAAHAEGKPLMLACADCAPCHIDVLGVWANDPHPIERNDS